jgi:hypothetical protein
MLIYKPLAMFDETCHLAASTANALAAFTQPPVGAGGVMIKDLNNKNKSK